ncbi:exonuclease 3' [Panicum miliaceum]|uniref:Exonuclease 3 n=1 Tax=Panicum miliaceum TaxID=4540 RepID=A0A3L6Q3Z3_PANMI|nr:exonuclease 3' [Panicum miliaceum]
MTSLLQLCIGICVLVFQVLCADGGDLPAVLKRFLTEEDHIFTGAHIENDVKRLRDDFGITISTSIDLQLVVPKAAHRYEYLGGPHPLFGVRCSSLEKIAREVLCLPRLRKEGADHDNWHLWYLLPSQVKYATTDVYLSYEIAKQLEIKDGYRF